MIDLKKIEQVVKEGKGLTRKEVMHLLDIRSYNTFTKKVQAGEIERINVSGETCYKLKMPITTGVNTCETCQG